MNPPFKQGELDSLCGVYAAINATKFVVGRISMWDAEELFEASLKVLEKRKSAILYITGGSVIIDVNRILRDVLCPAYNLTYSRPFMGKKGGSVDSYWNSLIEFLHNGENRAVIMAFETNQYRHWTVINEISEKRMKCFDSGHRKQIIRKKCTTVELNKQKSVLIYLNTTFFLWKP